MVVNGTTRGATRSRPAEGGAPRWLHAALDGYHRFAVHLDRVLIAVASALLVVGVLATAVSVLGRQAPQLFSDTAWVTEVTNLTIITAALLVVPQGIRRNTQLAVTALPERLGRRSFQALAALQAVLMGAFFFVIVRYGVDVMQLNSALRTPILGLSLFWPYLVVVLTGALMLLESVVRLLEGVAGRAARPGDGQLDRAQADEGGAAAGEGLGVAAVRAPSSETRGV